MSVGIVYDPIYLKHDTGQHPENARRLTAIMERLEKQGVLPRLTSIAPQAATTEEIALVHTRHHITHIKEVAANGGAWLDPDTYVSPDSYEVALYAAGGTIAAMQAVMGGKVRSAFALVRPPGHHAMARRAMGFCLFNNIAIAAAQAVISYKLERVMIVDFDVHHGNGTQEAFYERGDVLYVSTHEYPFYPGTGGEDETGRGPGAGRNINIPLPAGCGDNEYLRVFDEIIAPAARRYRPQLVLVSAGYDPHWADQLAMMQVSVAGFGKMARVIKNLADELCGGKAVFVLEGGYDLEALAASVEATFRALLGNEAAEDPLGPPPHGAPAPDVSGLIQDIKRRHSWF